MHRSTLSSQATNTPPLANTRRSHQQGNYQVLPPPPPPPPPLKPKRTFEYGVSSIRDYLHSESGAFLLANEVDYDSNNQEQDSNYMNKMVNKNVRKPATHQPQQQEGSTTSLDEEDLDLNDLKDFEDVTFDNLRKPEQPGRTTKQLKPRLNPIANNGNNNSEQSLLLKSSESSSANTINNAVACEAPNEIDKNLNELNSNNTQTTTIDASSNNTDLNTDDMQESKIYEETEI